MCKLHFLLVLTYLEQQMGGFVMTGTIVMPIHQITEEYMKRPRLLFVSCDIPHVVLQSMFVNVYLHLEDHLCTCYVFILFHVHVLGCVCLFASFSSPLTMAVT